MKLLPFLIGFVILQGITCSSAQCSYIGVAAGDSYDYSFSGFGAYNGVQETYSGTMHVHIDNVTYGNPCMVGVTVSPLGITLVLNFYFPPFDLHNGTFSVNNSLRALNGDFVISKNVLNKTLNYKTIPIYSYLNSDVLFTWDSNGMLNSIKGNVQGTNYNFQVDLERIGGSTPGPGLFMFAVIFVAGIAIIILKKRKMSRESITTT